MKRSLSAIQNRAYTLGLYRDWLWPEIEDKLFREVYPKIGLKCLSMFPGKSKADLVAYAQKLGIKVIKWSETDDNILKANSEKSISELSALLPEHTAAAIQNRLYKLNLREKTRKYWTPEMDRLLTANYHYGIDQCKHLFPGFTTAAIQSRASYLNLVTDRSKKAVQCIETAAIYVSLAEATRETKINNIILACKDSHKTAGGYHWRYIEK